MELKPLYEVGFKEVRKSHIYSVGGKDYPSVTKILGIIGGGKTNALMIWARREALKLAETEIKSELFLNNKITADNVSEILARADKQPDKIKDDAADLGTRVHKAIDAFILGQEPILEADTAIAFGNFKKWLESEKLTFVMGDTAVFSPIYNFGGKLDAIAIDPFGNLVLLDWKTSNAMRDEYLLQSSAYVHAFEQTYNAKISRAVIVRFGKDDAGDFEAVDVNIRNSFAAFLAARDLHDAMTGKKAKELFIKK